MTLSRPSVKHSGQTCLVLQMGGYAEALQTLMALRAAKHLYPSAEFSIIASEQTASLLKRVPWIREVYQLPISNLQSMPGSRVHCLDLLREWITPITHMRWDLVIDWTFTEASSCLSAIIPAGVRLGKTRRDSDQTVLCADGWSQYLVGVIFQGIGQNIHLTDILTTQLLTAFQVHVGDSADAGECSVTSKSFFDLSSEERSLSQWGLSPMKRRIALQLDSPDQATWAAEDWADLASLIMARHPDYEIVALGGVATIPIADQVIAELSSGDQCRERFYSLCGKTSSIQWVNILSQCHWVFSESRAGDQLASLLGTRSIAIAKDGMHWMELGPYANGSLLVEAAGRSPDPEAVYGAWTYGAMEWFHRKRASIREHFSQSGLSKWLSGHTFSRSRIRPSQDGGGIIYEPLTEQKLTLERWNAMVIGHVARAWYCGWVPVVGGEVSRSVITPDLIIKLREMRESIDVVRKVLLESVSIAGTIESKCKRMKSRNVMSLEDNKEIQALGERLKSCEELLDRVVSVHPAYKFLSSMNKVLLNDLRSENLTDMGREASECYRQLEEASRIFQQWIDHTIGLARPTAVQDGNVFLFPMTH